MLALSYRLFFLLVALPALLCAEEPAEILEKVRAHMQLRNFASAALSAEQGLINYPESKELRLALIEALSQKGDEIAAVSRALDPGGSFTESERNQMVEWLAWGAIGKAGLSNQLPIRMSTLVSAATTRDARALPLLSVHLTDSNSHLRSLAVRLVPLLGDKTLCNRLITMLDQEKVWYVRLELIRAIGQLRLREGEPKLREILSHKNTLAEERFAAVIALVSIYQSVSESEIVHLIASNRAGLRQLAAELILHFEMRSAGKQLIQLLSDSAADVRISALNALALLGAPEGAKDQIEQLLKDSNPAVAITAAWCSLVTQNVKGEEFLARHLHCGNQEWARFAAGSIAHSGSAGTALAQREIMRTSDPYVRMNLALALIYQRKNLPLAKEMLWGSYNGESSALWMWDSSKNPLFRVLEQSRVSHIDQIPSYPEAISGLTRLEILSILGALDFSDAQKGMKELLKNRSWYVAGGAAEALLQDGDQESRALALALLNDVDPKVRLQAALVLGFAGGEPGLATAVLIEGYQVADRETKMQIVRALGSLGDKQSIPFLLEVVSEPGSTLRTMAAGAIIECLYK